MSIIFDEVKEMQNIYSEGSVPMEKVKSAEDKLGLQFADDYKEYVAHFGTISCNGHELTGISCDTNLDVDRKTME